MISLMCEILKTQKQKRLVVVWVEGRQGGMWKMGEGGQRVQTSSIKWISFGDVIYNVVTIANSTVLCI